MDDLTQERISEIKESMQVYQDIGSPRIMAIANQPDGERLLKHFVKEQGYQLFKEFNNERSWAEKMIGKVYELFGKQYNPKKNINGYDVTGNTPMHHLYSYPGMVKILVEELGADVNKRNLNPKATPIVSASEMGRSESVEYLISSGARLDEVDKDGRNVLHAIAKEFKPRDMQGQLKVLDLIAKNPQMFEKLNLQKDKNNKTPLDYAKENSKIDNLKLINKLQGKKDLMPEENLKGGKKDLNFEQKIGLHKTLKNSARNI